MLAASQEHLDERDTSSHEPDLFECEQRRRMFRVEDGFFISGKRIEARELTEMDAAFVLDRTDGHLCGRAKLRRGERAEHVAITFQKVSGMSTPYISGSRWVK